MCRPVSRLRMRSGLFVCLVFLLCHQAWSADDHFGIEPVKFINEQISAGWADAKLQPSVVATDGEWCRRVFLDLVGRIPSVKELERYLQDSTPTKRADLVERLLGEEYEDEYARNWTDVWTMVLIGRDTENDQVNRPGMRQWLRPARRWRHPSRPSSR